MRYILAVLVSIIVAAPIGADARDSLVDNAEKITAAFDRTAQP